MMTAPLTLMPAPAPAPVTRTMRDIEEHLQALVDSTELVVAEQEQEFLADLQEAMISARHKRDRVADFLAQCEGQAQIAKAEITRLRKRQAYFESATQRMEGYVLRVVMEQPLDAKGRHPKLEGNTSSFEAKRNPPSISISDEAAVPASCKTVSVTMPQVLWDDLLDSLDLEHVARLMDAVGKPATSVVKAAVKDAIAAAVPDWKKQLEDRPAVFCDGIPGAAIAAGEYRLVRT